jgi:hypothetical protein
MNILPFPKISPDMRVGYIGTIAKNRDTRRTRREFLDKAKSTLPNKDYEQLLMAILDPEYYMKGDHLIRRAVDDYYDHIESRSK